MDLFLEDLLRQERGAPSHTCPVASSCKYASGQRPSRITLADFCTYLDQYLSGALFGRPPDQWMYNYRLHCYKVYGLFVSHRVQSGVQPHSIRYYNLYTTTSHVIPTYPDPAPFPFRHLLRPPHPDQRTSPPQSCPPGQSGIW